MRGGGRARPDSHRGASSKTALEWEAEDLRGCGLVFVRARRLVFKASNRFLAVAREKCDGSAGEMMAEHAVPLWNASVLHEFSDQI